MLKLIGAACILGGGCWFCWNQVSAQRRELDTLSDLRSALDQMSAEVRLARLPLPRLLGRLQIGRTPAVSTFFQSVLEALQQGEHASEAWKKATEALMLDKEDHMALAEVGANLSGDETQLCAVLSLATQRLFQSWEEKSKQRPEREKRATALYFSASALLIILLI